MKDFKLKIHKSIHRKTKVISQSIISGILGLFTITAYSQKPIIVHVSPRPITMDTQQSFVVEIPQTSIKEIKRDWLKYQGKGSKGKASELDGENHYTAVVNKNISADPF